MNEMPLVTRNYETLMNLQPGVVFGGAYGRPDARPRRAEWLFEHGVVLSQRRPQHIERLDD